MLIFDFALVIPPSKYDDKVCDACCNDGRQGDGEYASTELFISENVEGSGNRAGRRYA